mgnify:FL=1
MRTYSTITESFEEEGRNEQVRMGRKKIDWAASRMPILSVIREKFIREKPFGGEIIGVALHVEAKTAVLVELLVDGGAEVAITGCNPLSTHDDVSVALDSNAQVSSYAVKGVTNEEYYGGLEAVISHKPTLTLDDGGDLIFELHEKHRQKLKNIIGGCEETTTGVHRLKAMESKGEILYPIFAVNDTPMKRLFDNVHGTGESSLVSIAMTTNLSWAGKTIVIAGYGYCGRGVAKKVSGQNARVIITEINPTRALEAYMEGYEVMPMHKAAEKGDVFITTTGNRDIIVEKHYEVMKNGAILANAGHFNVEIDTEGLSKIAKRHEEIRDGITEYELENGNKICVLSEGRLVNLSTPLSLGHPIEIMDQSFGMQAVCMRELVDNRTYAPGIHSVPSRLDDKVAKIKLSAEGVEIDYLSELQQKYLDGWEIGT